MSLVQPIYKRTTPFVPCNRKARYASPHAKPLPRRQAIQAAFAPGGKSKGTSNSLYTAIKMTAAGIITSSLLWLSPMPADAEIQTVAPEVVTQMARPLPKQTFDKSKVWAICIGGAVVLFGATLVVESNDRWFPAIVRAKQATKVTNQRMKEAEERAKKEQELLQLRQAQYDEEQQQLAAVQQGLEEARAKVLGASAPPSSAPSTPSDSASSAGSVTADSPASSTESSSTSSGGSLGALAAAMATSLAEAAEAAPAAHGGSGLPSTPSSSTGAHAEGSELSSQDSYIVVADIGADAGAVAWPTTAAEEAAGSRGGSDGAAAARNGASSGGTTVAAAAEAPAAGQVAAAGSEEDAEARAQRLARFVSSTMAGSKGAMDAMKAMRK